jgi:hypothetical protein
MDEKARALEAWERELGTIQAGKTGSNVVRMRCEKLTLDDANARR